MTTALQSLSGDMADVVARARRSLVHVQDGRRGAGAGSIWHSDGLIVTNAHVAGIRRLQVTLHDGRELPARVLALDSGLDLAALAVEADGLPSMELGDSRGLRPGQLVLAMGYPWGVSGAVNAGAVIGSGPHQPDTPSPEREWIVAGLRLRPGHSGGPMMDVHGRLVGINTMITGPPGVGGGARGEGLPERGAKRRAISASGPENGSIKWRRPVPGALRRGARCV